jgi:thiol-disulfide isomerase/thioredoxin
MVKTESTDLALGQFPLPSFTLPVPATGGTVTDADSAGKVTWVMFLGSHCPFVILLKKKIAELARTYAARGVSIVAICSNSEETHPQDGPAAIKAEVEEYGYCFPYAYDRDGAIAKAFHAACTPDLYIFTADGKLFYHGQFDAARPGNDIAPTGADLATALDDALAGRPLGRPIKRSIGCNIKFAPGNEPEYFQSK